MATVTPFPYMDTPVALKVLQQELSNLHPQKTVWKSISVGKTNLFVPLSGGEKELLKTEIEEKLKNLE